MNNDKFTFEITEGMDYYVCDQPGCDTYLFFIEDSERGGASKYFAYRSCHCTCHTWSSAYACYGNKRSLGCDCRTKHPDKYADGTNKYKQTLKRQKEEWSIRQENERLLKRVKELENNE